MIAKPTNGLSPFLRILLLLSLPLAVSFQSSAQSIVASGYNFTATSKTYNYLSGGTRVTAVEVDDAYTTIPIGFTFTFCGAQYTDVTVCSNGWLRFGSGAGSSVANWNYNANAGSGIDPAVYVLYEDVSGDIGTSQYEVTGTAPDRIFKWECRDWLWDYAASNASVSFQVWLYEATGEIECLYKQESGAVSVGTSGGATIGIGNSATDWQTLDNISSNPTPSSTKWTSNLSARPASGQSYMWDPGPPCSQPAGLAVNLVNSTVIDFSWNLVKGSQGYEYLVDQNTASPTTGTTITTSTGVVETGLTPNTQYYIHLRNKCGNTNYSPWMTLPVKTLHECSVPTDFKVVVNNTTANFSWKAIGTANEYEYVVDQFKVDPVNTTGVNVTTYNYASASPLLEGEVYYVHIRSLCPGSDSSDWSLDSIYVPIKCRVPDVKFTDINTQRAVAYWPEIRTAVNYEYLVSTTATPPAYGSFVTGHGVHVPNLDAGKKYYFHVRTHCSDRNVESSSPWGTYEFSTEALSVETIVAENNVAIYPNPARDNITFSVENIEDDARLIITDISGKVVRDVMIDKKETNVSLEGIEQGVYLFKYTTPQSSKVYKVLKQ